jgi:hemolysin III
MNQVKLFQYSRYEELANAITHLMGIIFGIYSLVSLLFSLPLNYSSTSLISYLIYSLSLILLYTSSTCYHFAKTEKFKALFKKADHICIYYLIAGTYTPFLLVSIGGGLGGRIFCFIWLLAMLGTIFKLNHSRKFQKLSVFMYLAMGWLVLSIWGPLSSSISVEGIRLILFGGLLYTSGVVFYIWKSLKYHHMIWHLFVLAGSVVHFLAVKTIIS